MPQQQIVQQVDDGPFAYLDGTLCIDRLPLGRMLAGVGTPAYVYSTDAVAGAYRRISDAFEPIGGRVHYAVKAGGNLALLRRLVRLGSGFEVVSGGELTRVLRAGGDPAATVFSGVGKTRAELAMAVGNEVTVHVESTDELDALELVAAELERGATFALRANPDVGVDTHPHLATGHDEAKFGVPVALARELLERAASGAWPHLQAVGVHVHVGSQLPDPQPLVEGTRVALDLIEAGRAAGLRLDRVDVGGGLPVDYGGGAAPGPEVFARALAPLVDGRGVLLQVEPGRAVVARAGALVAGVLYRKHRPAGRMLVLDTGMHHLIRPALYGAGHRVLPLQQASSAAPTELVGPICESTDVLGVAELPDLAPGELVAILDAGAYGMAMASNYNAQPRPAEVVVEDGVARLARRRETWQEQLVWEYERDSAMPVLPSRALRQLTRIDDTAEFKIVDEDLIEQDR
ncbi:MAG TPA: diaminopimelate decarboxylase [Actinomycetes bacterium]|nr:diaminopimelate decarboxylase [Actinomycetes bacterium]